MQCADYTMAMCVNGCLTSVCPSSRRSSLCSNSLAEPLKLSMFVRGCTVSLSPCLAIRPGNPKDMASQIKTNKSLCDYISSIIHLLYPFSFDHTFNPPKRRNLLNLISEKEVNTAMINHKERVLMLFL